MFFSKRNKKKKRPMVDYIPVISDLPADYKRSPLIKLPTTLHATTQEKEFKEKEEGKND